MASSVKNFDPSEELISDRFYDVIDPQFHYSTITQAQNLLLSVPAGHSEIFDKLKSSLVGFTQEPLPHFPELVQCFSLHYSITEKVVLDYAHSCILLRD